MIIGEPDYVGPDVRDLFMATGTVHILSISGSHLGLIALLLFGMFSMIFRGLPTPWLLSLSRHITPMRVAALATAFAVTWYALLAGAQIATMRSLVMLLIFLTAVWLGRGHSVLRAWAAAALVVLVHDPRALFDISFQFSYLSVLAIALVLHWNETDKADELPVPWQERARRWGHDYLLITGAVTLVTFPLAAYYFNQMAWLGLIANLVIVPLAGFVLVPAGLLSALLLLIGGGEALPGAAVHEALGNAMVNIVTLLATVPEATRHVASPGMPTMAVFFCALYMACRPGVSRAPGIAAALVAVALVCWWAVSPRAWSDGDTVRVTFLDVGQGDACVIELPDGHTVLIDGGTAQESLDMGRAVVAPYLWDRGITRLDHVIATHPQLDHIGGLAAVLRSFEVGRYWSNGVRRDEAFYRRVQDSLTARGVTEDVAEAGRVILQTETCRLLVLNPPRESVVPMTAGPAPAWTHYSGSGTELNNHSVVTRLDCGPHSFLFTADIERAAMSRLRSASRLLAAHVIKVPHHGAHSSWEAGWGHAVGSAVSVISVGKHNAYGHPSPAVLAGYGDDGSRVFRTDEEGAIWVIARLSSPAFEIHSVRQHRLLPVAFGPTMLTDEWANLRRLWAQWSQA
jgi:competence protein ComEC